MTSGGSASIIQLKMDLALLVIRVVIGLLFVGHGAQKLSGVLSGRTAAAHDRHDPPPHPA